MRRRTSRRGTTLIELLVAFAILSVVLAVFWTVRSSGERQGKHVENTSDLMTSATILQEVLSWDMQRCLPLQVLPAEVRQQGVRFAELELPGYGGYEGDDPDIALRYRTVHYVWDAEARTLTRNGRTVAMPGLKTVEFEWTTRAPVMLKVHLEGDGLMGRKGARMTLRVAAPPGTNGLHQYRFSAHHATAKEKDEVKALAMRYGGYREQEFEASAERAVMPDGGV